MEIGTLDRILDNYIMIGKYPRVKLGLALISVMLLGFIAIYYIGKFLIKFLPMVIRFLKSSRAKLNTGIN
jgi:hypothetical protein